MAFKSLFTYETEAQEAARLAESAGRIHVTSSPVRHVAVVPWPAVGVTAAQPAAAQKRHVVLLPFVGHGKLLSHCAPV